MTSDLFSFSFFNKFDFNFTFAFFRSFVFYKISSIFMICNLSRNECFLLKSSSFSIFLLHYCFSLFFRKSIKGFLCFLIHNFFFRNLNIQPSDFNIELISSSCSIFSFSISCLNVEHCFSINMISF